jgi:hypothetical protein
MPPYHGFMNKDPHAAIDAAAHRASAVALFNYTWT